LIDEMAFTPAEVAPSLEGAELATPEEEEPKPETTKKGKGKRHHRGHDKSTKAED
jgi:hypothetical protein